MEIILILVVSMLIMLGVYLINPNFLEDIDAQIMALSPEDTTKVEESIKTTAPATSVNVTETAGEWNGVEVLTGVMHASLVLMAVLGVILIILWVYGLIVGYINSRIDEREQRLTTTIRINNELKPMKLEDINEVVLLGEDIGKGKVGSIRRLHAILEVGSEGELHIPCNVRLLRSEEGFKQKLCKDVVLSESEWESVKSTYRTLSEEYKLKDKIKKSKEYIEENRKRLVEEQKLKRLEITKQDKYIKEYLIENGEQALPTWLMKESERLEYDLKLLSDELINLGKDNEDITGNLYK